MEKRIEEGIGQKILKQYWKRKKVNKKINTNRKANIL